MDELNRNDTRPVNPRRRKRSKLQIFKEAYLPVIIAGIALILILVFLVGSIVRAVQRNQYNKQIAIEESIAAQDELERLTQEASTLLSAAELGAKQYDYDYAIAVLSSFSGDVTQFPEISEKKSKYIAAKENLVLWNDPNMVLNLSFQMLIADPARSFSNADYGTSYNRNFVTTGEFSKILQQLYENGYILVSLSDITSAEGPKDLYLPKGKKPLIITQTNVNYYTYMLDSDGDKLPDKDGAGFASKLIHDATGRITCEMIDSDGNTVTGDYDLVPILDSFVKAHPDFSYKGAKAILSVSGYDGIFGYRTGPSAESYFGKAYRNQEIQQATALVNKLRQNGYEIACYTYENEPYGDYTAGQIKEELTKWREEVTPVLGETDIFVFSRNSDIATKATAYSGDKFNALKAAGYVYYLGFSEDGETWYSSHGDYIRQGRILVSGSNMKYHPQWFEGIFDASTVLDPSRGTIPG